MSLFCTPPVSKRGKRSLLSDWTDQLTSIGTAFHQYLNLNSTERADRVVRDAAAFRDANLDPDYELTFRRRQGPTAGVVRNNSPDYESRSGYGHTSYHHSGGHHDSGYGHSASYGHSSYGHDDCCPLVIDPLLLTALLGFTAAATYFLRSKFYFLKKSRIYNLSISSPYFYSRHHNEHYDGEEEEAKEVTHC